MSRDFERRYSQVIRDFPPSATPTTVELAGYPRTGKSLFAEALRGLLVKCSASVAVAPRDTWDCPIEDKWGFDYSIWTVSTLVHAWLDAKHRKTEFFVADRGWFDALLWLRLKVERGVFSRAQADAFRGLIECDGVWPDRFVVLVFTSSDASTLLARGKERRLLTGDSRVTTKATLESLGAAIVAEVARATERGVSTRLVDVTNRSVEETIHAAASELLTELEHLGRGSERQISLPHPVPLDSR